MRDEKQAELSESIYAALSEKGVETLIDDRNERVGVKFKDADLIGIPIKITVGKRAAEGIVEYKRRSGGEVEEITIDEALDRVTKYMSED